MMLFEARPDRKIPTPEPLETKPKVTVQEPVDFSERLRKAEEQRKGLHKAAKEGGDLVFQLLLAEGADVNSKASDGKTALSLRLNLVVRRLLRFFLRTNPTLTRRLAQEDILKSVSSMVAAHRFIAQLRRATRT